MSVFLVLIVIITSIQIYHVIFILQQRNRGDFVSIDENSSKKLKEKGGNTEITLRIYYETTENSDGVQWLNTNQTNLKE